MNLSNPTSCVRRAALSIVIFSVCAAGGPADAQVSTEREVISAEEIIITARRRDEPLAKSAEPISALSGEDVTRLGIDRVENLNQEFPALTVQPTATGNLIFIRGVGNFTLQPNSDAAVGYAYDGVFVSRPMGTMSQFFDLARIELLKGPQGVLYGRNASAGSINVEPRQPVIDERSVSATLEASTLTELQGEAALNVPFGATAALRISGAVSAQDEVLTGYSEGPRQYSARAQVKTHLTEGITARLSGDFNRIGGVGLGTSYVGNYVFDGGTGRYRLIESGIALSQGLYWTEAQAYRQTIFLVPAGRTLDAIESRPRQGHEFYGIHSHIEADLGFGELTVIPAWRRASIDAIVSGSPFGFQQRERDEQASLEARLAGRSGPIDWLAGTFVFDESIDSDTLTNLSSLLARSKQRYDTFSRALFGNVTFHVSDRFRLGGGLRWTVDRKRYDSAGTSLLIMCKQLIDNRPSCPSVPLFPLTADYSELPFDVPSQPGPSYSLPITLNDMPTGAIVTRSELTARDRLTDRAVTWRIGGEMDLASRTLAYASIGTGYRPGGFNTASGFETYDPERIRAYTLGLRHRDRNGKLQLDLEAFWWNYRDQQVSSLRPDLSTPPQNANITDNIGNSRIRGLEADVRFRPQSSTQLRAIVQFLDAEYRSFSYVQVSGPVPPLTGCAAAISAATNVYTVDCGDKQPYNSPRWALTLDARQSFVLKNLSVTALAGTHFRSARNIGFAFLPEQRIDASWTSHAQLILSPSNYPWEFAAFVRNIEGDRIPQFMIYHPFSNALVAATSTPRVLGLRLSTRFGMQDR